MRPTSLILAALSASLAAATLDIYSDAAYYTYTPKTPYVGFVSGVSLEQGGGETLLQPTPQCDSSTALCQLHEKIASLQSEHATLQKEQELLMALAHNSRENDAARTLEFAATLSKRLHAIESESRQLSDTIASAKAAFEQMAPTSTALAFSPLPKAPVTLTLTNGLSFENSYLLESNSGTLRHFITMQNRSGIDIEAQEVRLFERPSRYIRPPQQFTPRKIRANAPQPRAKNMMASDAVAFAAAPVAQEALHISKQENRAYRIKGLSLPSDGSKKRSEIETERLTLEQSLRWDAYATQEVYETLSFTTNSPIEAHHVSVRHKEKTIEHVPFLKENGRVSLHVARDYDVEVSKKAITEFSESKGFFGSDRLKQEGFELRLHNHGTQSKRIEIIERIPVSTEEKIRVTLEKVTGVSSYDYDAKSGKLSLQVTVKPQETKPLRFSYAIRYPETMNIRY